jgi:hypothetical protein
MSQFDCSQVHYVNYASLAANQRKTSISFVIYDYIIYVYRHMHEFV